MCYAKRAMENAYIPPGALQAIRARLSEQDRAIVDLLAGTGYRLDDILYSRVYHWSGDSVSLRERKTGNIRTVRITPETRSAIAIINRTNKPIGQPHRPRLSYFLPTTRINPPTGCRAKRHRSTIHAHFARAVQEAGYAGCGYTVHSLRKVYAHRLYERTGSLLAVQRDLGHKHLATTLLYALGDAVRL